MTYKKGLFIFRRDFRIKDNLALNKAHNECEQIYPVFIFTPEQVSNKNTFKSDNAVQFMIESLDVLEKEIKRENGVIHFYYGENNKIISNLIKKWRIDCIYFNEDITPYAKKRDASIKKLCANFKIECKTAQDYYLYEPGSIVTTTGTPYTKFTPYYNNVLSRNVDNPKYIQKFKFSNNKDSESITLKEAYISYTIPNPSILVNGGRDNALKIINSISTFENYGKERNDLGKRTTLLSAYIKFGCISIREAYHKIKKVLGLNTSLMRQLIWRDFYAQLLYSFPQVLGSPLKEKYDDIEWENNPRLFQLWKEGKTGFPIVDAGMRQLNKTGYMHNRARLITASFLIKILLIDWQKGEKYFAQKLTDYDPASNNGNWQWVSSTGADSQPYFRIFSPWRQSEKHDKDASYIKKWIPELKNVDNKHIHAWDEYYSNYKDVSYPKPCVDYSTQRNKAVTMYRNAIEN